MTNWLELACHSAKCAPPPAGTGGSEDGGKLGDTGGDHAVGVSADPNSDSLQTVVKRRDGESDEDFHHRVFLNGQEKYEPAHELTKMASDYRAEMGLVEPQVSDWTSIEAPWAWAKVVADGFAKLHSDPDNPEVKAAYKDLVTQTVGQYELLTQPVENGGLGIKVDYVSPKEIAEKYGDEEGLNPYPTAKAQRDDIVNNKHLAIASIADYPSAYHPLLDNSRGGEYDTFRAVHDAFGHAATGADFSRHGEFQSWLHHVSMFSGGAARAASTELTAENSYLFTTHNPATHKAALIPAPLVDPWDGDNKVDPWGDEGRLPFTPQEWLELALSFATAL